MNQPLPQPPFKRRWRNLLLDRRLQLKHAAYSVAAATAAAALLGGFLWSTSSARQAEAEQAVEARSRAAQASRELGKAALNQELLDRFDDPAFKTQLLARAKAVDEQYEKERQAVIAQHETLLARQRNLTLVIVLGLGALVLLVGAGSIVATHKIVGPVFRMKRLLREVADGRLNEPAPLRKGDELQELFEEYDRMVRAQKERRARLEEECEGARQRAQALGDPELGERLARLRELAGG